jgi:DNA polymerase-3 subunit delta'
MFNYDTNLLTLIVKITDLIGQEILKTEIRNEINSGKIAHAKLFVGKPGFGTLPLALYFAQYLFCEKKLENGSCGVCPSCKRVKDFNHPDVHYVYPIVKSVNHIASSLISTWKEQLNTNVYFNLSSWSSKIDSKNYRPIIAAEESKEIIYKLNLKSYEGGPKVMIIWMAEEMNVFCSNKLLKIIEEPPSDTYIVLVCENIQNLLPTIQSRTQRINVPFIHSDDLSSYLISKFELSRSEADSVASFAEGDFLNALDYLSANENQVIHREQFIQMMRLCYKKDVIGMLDWSEKMTSESKEHQKFFIVYSLHMFRQSILANYIGSEIMRVSEEEEKFLKNFSPYISGNNIREFQKTFDDAHYHIDRNANAKILFTQLCFQTMRYIHFA